MVSSPHKDLAQNVL